MCKAELYLRQAVFTYSADGLFTEHLEIIQKLKKVCDQNYLCISFANSKDLAKRTALDKILKDRAYEIALNSKYYWKLCCISF